MSHVNQKDDIHRHSGWLIPGLVLCAILLLSGLFLGWYLRPGPRLAAAPTGQVTLVDLTVHGQAFTIPANYIQSPAARAGGEQNSVTLAALFPSWHGYSDDEAKAFWGNAPDSPVVRLSLRGEANPLNAADRLARIYLPYVLDPKGTPGPFGLTQYGFARNSGYERQDLFAGEKDGRLLLFLCEQPAPELPSPNCLATDQPLGKSASLSWRFKRAYLARWRELSDGVNALMARFESKS
ncbi:MAG TPA: hypothetical protein VHC39_16480 [Rhizomicrobium sp.]|nr:hypothetical protein [Rhizomicrobium sp.]